MKSIAKTMLGALTVLVSACGGNGDADNSAQGESLVAQGRHIFRFETFGDEAKWTDTLRMHDVIAASVDPATALSVGLKVDADALPQSLKDDIARST